MLLRRGEEEREEREKEREKDRGERVCWRERGRGGRKVLGCNGHYR